MLENAKEVFRVQEEETEKNEEKVKYVTIEKYGGNFKIINRANTIERTKRFRVFLPEECRK